MKTKLRYILFCTFLLVLVFSVFIIDPRPEFLFNNAKGDCSARSFFIFSRLYHPQKESSVVFFGSSKTMNGINDSMLSAKGKTSLNLGYCRYGRNLDYFFIKEYLSDHHPQKIVLEVRPFEDDNSHPVSSFFLPTSMILDGFVTLNGNTFKDLYNKWLCNLKYLRSRLFGKAEPVLNKMEGPGYWPANQTQGETELSEQFEKEKKKKRIGKSEINRNSNFYLNKIKELCREKNTELLFLYLPSFGNVNSLPACEDEYRRLGQLLIPPDSILSNPDLFANYDHFNRKGAIKLTLWCNDQLEKDR